MIADDLVGQSYVFPDGNFITITQVKLRDGNEKWITCSIQNGPGIPRREVLAFRDFIEHFGHLFNLSKTDDISTQ